MDRPISKNETKSRRIKWATAILISCALVWLGIQFIYAKIRPTLNQNEIIVGTLDRGPVSAVIETTGVLAPEHERVLSAPGETRILRVVRKPGSLVSQGDPILQLDTTALELERDGLAQQLGVKENAQRQAMLQFEKQAKQDQAKLELIELDLKYFEAQHRQQVQLFEKGLVSKEALQQAELQMEKTRVEKRQLIEAGMDGKSSHKIELEGFSLELNLLKKSLASAENLLKRATTNAPSDGVLTWVLEAEGTTVRSGDPLARIADLTNFKVTATISDYYADRISNKQKAIIRVGEAEFEGKIERLLPEVTNGTMAFDVSFDNQKGIPLLPKQRATVFLITAKRQNALRVRRSAAITNPGQSFVYVIRGKTAVRTLVEIGITGSNYTEIMAGLEEGDRIVLSDMSTMNNLSHIPIQ